MAGMLVSIFVVGLYPRVLTDVIESGIDPIAAIVQRGA